MFACMMTLLHLLLIGMYYDLVDLSDFVLRKSLVPPKEACVSSAEVYIYLWSTAVPADMHI